MKRYIMDKKYVQVEFSIMNVETKVVGMSGDVEVIVQEGVEVRRGSSVVKIYPKIEGNRKRFDVPETVFSSIFVVEPEIFSYPGDSLENDVFPMIANKNLLYCYMSREGETHIHSKEDIKFVKEF